MIDVRGPRFAAWLTTAVLIAAIFASSLSTTAAAWILGVQTVVFAAGALLGIRWSPYSSLFRYAVAPAIGKPRQFEDERPLRFAQTVGLLFGLVATVGFAFGTTAVGLAAAALALSAAFLNAAFGFCLGCQMYLLIRTRLGGPVSTPAH